MPAQPAFLSDEMDGSVGKGRAVDSVCSARLWTQSPTAFPIQMQMSQSGLVGSQAGQDQWE